MYARVVWAEQVVKLRFDVSYTQLAEGLSLVKHETPKAPTWMVVTP